MSIKHLGEIPTGSPSPCRGDKYKRGIKIFKFSTNNISQTTQDSAIVRPTIEGEEKTSPQPFECYQLQWPWVTINLDFKVTVLLSMPSTLGAQLMRGQFAIHKLLSYSF